MSLSDQNNLRESASKKSATIRVQESAKIRVLVIDDSLFMRTLISDMLNSDSGIKVIDTAKDGQEAIEKLSRIKPDCITLDLSMPGWDGLTTLKHIMAEYPVPVIILSAHSKQDADITIKCLNAGAVGFMLKPSGELSLDIEKVKQYLIEEVKAAAEVSVKKIKKSVSFRHFTNDVRHTTYEVRHTKYEQQIIVIGASTGGPQTLEKILYFLPINFPAPIIIIQHMPSIFFTESFAAHLNKVTDLKVKVAEDDETIKSCNVYIAPAGFQTLIAADNPRVSAYIRIENPRKSALTPSIDITMKSAAQVYGRGVVGIILTGMGSDGKEGMKAIKSYGGRTIVQDKDSLIFGMPKAVIDAGCADEILPAEKIAEALIKETLIVADGDADSR